MFLSLLAVAFSAVGAVPYIRGIVRGNVRPERMTWFIWSLVLTLALFGYHAVGAGSGVWFVVAELGANTLVLGLSLWHGKGGCSRLDLLCLAIALAALLLWKCTNQPFLMLLGSIVADVMAVVPTVLKALVEPFSEDAAWFWCSAGASLCGLLAAGRWNVQMLLYPAYLFVVNLTTAMIIGVGQYHTRRFQRVEGK